MEAKGTVLVVDDEDDFRATLVQALAKVADRILDASNADAALALIRKERIQAICCDIKMPGRSGLEFIRQIRELGYSTPVVIITGYADQANTLEALRLGAMDFLEKPIDINALRKLMGDALRLGTEIERMDEELKASFTTIKAPPEKIAQFYQAQRQILLMRLTSQFRRGKP